ncbi:MAG: hypothetical protein PVJ67_03300 [Candidatus Pacearchaeota archaeon]|jgi:hypothetical protein
MSGKKYDRYIITKRNHVATINLYDASEENTEGIAPAMRKGVPFFVNMLAHAQENYEKLGIPFVSGEFKNPISESQLLKILEKMEK